MKSVVYFIRPVGGGPIKIGYGIDANIRRQFYQGWSPLPLELIAQMPGDQMQESYLHAKFAQHRLRGEWFRPDYPVAEAVHQIQETGAYHGLPPVFEFKWSSPWRVVNRLREVRETRLHMTREELAKSANVSLCAVSKWETYPVTGQVVGRIIYLGQTLGIHLHPSEFAENVEEVAA